MEDKIRYKIVITGRVQGVGFRWNAVREAGSRGITGLVKNMTDGRVYIEAEGYREQLDDYIAWCRRGPVFSSVENVEIEASSPMNYKSFNIEH